MNPVDLSIIIVNYKSKAKLANCLQSLSQADLGGLNYEITVVENNSGDDLSELIASQSNINLIISAKNLGMGGGNNLGIKSASGKHILVLNPDTIVRGDVIKKLFFYLNEHEDVGLVAPKLLYPDGKLQLSCSRFPSFFVPILRRTFLGNYFSKTRDDFMMTSVSHNEIMEVDWVMGSCLMFKRNLVLASGEVMQPRFDERYFMYFEDTDLCRSVKSAGYKVIYYPETVVIHDHARESAKHPWYIALFRDKITWVHIISWFKYFIKWGFNPQIKK